MAKNKTRPAAAAAISTGSAKPGKQLTCFVVTGFGEKTDYSTGRVLNLDKTYELLVRPACDKVNVNCFRAIDANLTGSIDSIMYRWIYEADMVIADLSTLNANVFYELGVRHAQRPNTTVIIAESVLIQRIPFDLSSFVVHKYEHGGKDISQPEQERFVEHLSGVLAKIIATETQRQQDEPLSGRETDSPVYTYLKGMTPPAFKADTSVAPPAYVPPADRKTKDANQGGSLASIIDAAEAAKESNQFGKAIELFADAMSKQIERRTSDKKVGTPDAKPELFLAQRLALVTYKHGERKDEKTGKPDPETAKAALFEARAILEKYCEPSISNDPETLGLSGAINKRLFEWTGKSEYLDRSIGFYERGFYITLDYYNGINVAYMYNLRARQQATRYDAIVDYGHANMIRRLVVEICEALVKDEAAFANRGDRQWVYMTLAEAYQGMGRAAEAEDLVPRIKQVQSNFSLESFTQQAAKLQAAIEDFRRKFRPDELDAAPTLAPALAPAAPPPADAVAAAVAAPAADAADRAPAVRAAAMGSGRPITVDADLEPGRPVKSIEISCKIEYS